jgi:tetratricopeptide (TPR) repeat protein
VWIQYGHALKEQGRLEDAEQAYGSAIDQRPDQPAGYAELGLFLLRLGRRREAAMLFSAGLIVAPDRAELTEKLAFLQLSDADADLARWQGALSVRLRRLPITTFSGRDRRARAKARMLAREGKWESAATAYRDLVKRHPSMPALQLQLAHALKEAGHRDAAIAAYIEVVFIDPFYLEGHLQLGHALRRFGDEEGAIAAFKRALRLDPISSTAKRELEAMGLRGNALADLLASHWLSSYSGAGTRYEPHERTLSAGHQKLRSILQPPSLTTREYQIFQQLYQHVAGRN